MAKDTPGDRDFPGEAEHMEIGSGAGGTLDELLNLMEIDPDALREAEFEQTQAILDTLAGKTIASARIEDTRIVLETADGNRYFFFGFMGSGSRR
ncbi:MAG: hypothetical protein ACREM2_04160 [Vulcanimicrobiaceae bacterium]